jgi:hypothetical protein
VCSSEVIALELLSNGTGHVCSSEAMALELLSNGVNVCLD